MSWSGIDYHNHICGAPIDMMIARARSCGIREFAITEHIYMLYEGQIVFPGSEEQGSRSSRAEYVERVNSHADAGSELQLRLGLEVDYLPGTEVAVEHVLTGVEWDILLGSVHEIDGSDIFQHVPSTQFEGESMWRRYYELIAEAIESGMFDVITHPVRNAERNKHVPHDLDTLLEDIASFATFHGVALELNGYDTVNCPRLVERLAAACGRTGCAVSLGSDAHSPEEVAQGLQDATRFAVAGGVKSAIEVQRRDRRLVSFT